VPPTPAGEYDPVIDPVVSDARFMVNVREALANGYATCCSYCGVGIYEDPDPTIRETHERECPEFAS
jgi:hypothetical protein